MIRLGFIGAGLWMRTYHLPTVRRLTESKAVAPVAIWNRTPSKARELADAFGIARVHTSLSAFIADTSVDACVVALTKAAVGTVLRRLCVRELPILVEKPPAADVREARDLVTRLRTSVMVAFNRNYTPLYERLATVIANRSVDYSECHFLRRGRNDEHFVSETGIHAIALLDSLLGGAALIRAARIEHRGSERPPDWHAEIVHDGGCRTHLHFLPNAGHSVERYQFHMHDCSIYVRMKQHYAADDESALTIHTVDRAGDPIVIDDTITSNDTLVHDGYLGAYRRFLDYVQGGSTPPTTLEHCTRIMEIAQHIEAGSVGDVHRELHPS